ncbi:MAG: alpha/beta hydrolase fold protein [Solirubrobacterales bacterium]|nr:alpha/beta hydrolase fold protein [Solirubrobacterales bacterium]
MNEELDLRLASGRVRAQRSGAADAPLVLAVHGLSANLHAFDFLAARLLAGRERQLVALDLRGRGASDVTPPGTYGLEAHARDVLEAATLLGAERFDWIGWSMGALIGILAANAAPERVRSLGLIDHAGAMDPAAVDAVLAGLNRLDFEAADAGAYVDRIRPLSPISPFTEFWETYYAYEFGRTSKTACREDFDDVEHHDWPALWPALTMPTTLVRCTVPLNGGFVVPKRVASALHETAPGVTVTEIRADHFTVMTDANAAAALGAGLDQARAYA